MNETVKPDETVKPGWQTTEFWTPIISLIVMALVNFHTIPSADSATVMGYLTAIVSNVIGLGGSILLMLHYVRSRTQMKAALLAQAQAKLSK